MVYLFSFFAIKKDHHVCNGKCFDYTIPCNGTCQHANYYQCDSGDQCYRYWDHCDKILQCDDGSDEGSVSYIYFEVSFLDVQLKTNNYFNNLSPYPSLKLLGM